MPRIRTIKPEFWQDEKLAPLSPIDRLVFLGLISMADDAGRLVDSVKHIDGAIFACRDEESSRDSLDTLARLSRITRYVSASGQHLIQICNWLKHQKVDNPSAYVLPSAAVAKPSLKSRETRARSSRSDPDLGSRILDPDLGSTTSASAATNGQDPPKGKDSWLEPYRAAWEAANGQGSFATVAGQCAKCLRSLDGAHGPAAVASALTRYLAAEPAQYRSVSRFAQNYAAYNGQALPPASQSDGERADRIRGIVAKFGAGPQFMTAKQYADEFGPEDLAFIKRKGGVAAIWNSLETAGK